MLRILLGLDSNPRFLLPFRSQPAQKCGDRRAYHLHSSPRSLRIGNAAWPACCAYCSDWIATPGSCSRSDLSPLKSVAIVARIICILPLGRLESETQRGLHAAHIARIG